MTKPFCCGPECWLTLINCITLKYVGPQSFHMCCAAVFVTNFVSVGKNLDPGFDNW